MPCGTWSSALHSHGRGSHYLMRERINIQHQGRVTHTLDVTVPALVAISQHPCFPDDSDA